MRERGIRRRAFIVIGAALVIAGGPAVQPASASGGGGCGRPVTDARGTTVNVRNYCFGPTVLRVHRGETVTWVNRDGFPHTVLGANGVWGSYDTLHRSGGHLSYRFTRSGVYPYVCTYHVGMVGAVVVGNGKGAGAAHTMMTSTGPVIAATRASTARVAAAPVAPTADLAGDTRPWPAQIIVAAGLLLIALALTRVGRGRRAHRAGALDEVTSVPS